MNITDNCAREVYQGYYNVPLLDIEKDFDYMEMSRFAKRNFSVAIAVVTAYFFMIFAGPWFMRSRAAFELRPVLFLWNTAIALFSIFACSRLLPAMAYMIRDHGMASIMCDIGVMEHRQTIGVWACLFVYSKFVELGDTVFIILLKKRLIFLHWYHHISVLLFVMYTGGHISAMGFPFMTLNYFVHSVYYTYLALKALKIRLPRTVGMMVTALEILQMMLGIYVTLFVVWNRVKGHSCCAPKESIVAAMIMYGSFFVLFIKFFLDVYWRKISKDSKKKIA